jgi:hypothetical protein
MQVICQRQTLISINLNCGRTRPSGIYILITASFSQIFCYELAEEGQGFNSGYFLSTMTETQVW